MVEPLVSPPLAKPRGDLTRRVAERLATANREVADLVDETQDDPIAQYGAVLDANARYIRAISEIVTMLAIEIERIELQQTPPPEASRPPRSRKRSSSRSRD
jgi:hypothetical protein